MYELSHGHARKVPLCSKRWEGLGGERLAGGWLFRSYWQVGCNDYRGADLVLLYKETHLMLSTEMCLVAF